MLCYAMLCYEARVKCGEKPIKPWVIAAIVKVRDATIPSAHRLFIIHTEAEASSRNPDDPRASCRWASIA